MKYEKYEIEEYEPIDVRSELWNIKTVSFWGLNDVLKEAKKLEELCYPYAVYKAIYLLSPNDVEELNDIEKAIRERPENVSFYFTVDLKELSTEEKKNLLDLLVKQGAVLEVHFNAVSLDPARDLPFLAKLSEKTKIKARVKITDEIRKIVESTNLAP
jgi:hypothetical protein